MADKNTLKDKIKSTIYPNGKGAISAAEHQSLLLDMADIMGETDTKLTELSAEVSKKADTDGKYAELVSGDLYGHGESVETEFSFRASGGKSIKDGTAYVKEVHGNAVVWNQCFGNGTTNSDYLNWDGNVATINGEFEADNTSYDTTSSGARFVAPIIGHKYLVEIDIISGTISGRLQNYLECAAKTINLYEDKLSAKEFITPTTTSSYWIARTMIANTIATNLKVRHRITDLTQMFGAGNEPTTIEEFNRRKAIVEDENAYNEGEVIPFRAEGIKSVGDNAWDEEWEVGSFDTTSGANLKTISQIRNKNLIKVIGGETYSCIFPTDGLWLIFFDRDGNVVPKPTHSGITLNNAILVREGSTDKFTAPTNAVGMKFYTATSYGEVYKNDITISLYHSGWKAEVDNTYKPYWSDTLMLDARIKEAFPNGMMPWDKVYNKDGKGYIERAKDGKDRVDMGTLNWKNLDTTRGLFYLGSDVDALGMKRYVVDTITPQLLSKHYRHPNISSIERLDKVFRGPYTTAYSGYLTLKDTAYTNVTTLKADLQGVILYYEPTEMEVLEYDEPFNLDYKVADFGTEEIISQVPSAAFKGRTIYQFNAVDQIRENYNEIEKIKAALAKAGITI